MTPPPYVRGSAAQAEVTGTITVAFGIADRLVHSNLESQINSSLL